MPLTPDEIEAERERFEAWAIPLFVRFKRGPCGEYASFSAWAVHQSRLAAIASERDLRKQEQPLLQGEGK